MIIEKTTIPYEHFKKIPVTSGSESFKDQIRKTFGDTSNDDATHLGKYPQTYSGYALSIGAKDITHVTRRALLVPGIVFNTGDFIDRSFVREHHDFLKRGTETVSDTIERIRAFKEQGGLSYVVQSTAGEIIGTMSVKQSGVLAAVFSFMVIPEYRKKGLGKFMVGNVHEDLIGRGVQSIRAKTKNKYVYHLIKRLYKGEVLRKEIYT